jgi:hypothetical protein
MMEASSVFSTQSPLLIVEDSNEDFEALRRYIQQYHLPIPLYRCTKGDQAGNTPMLLLPHVQD